MRIRVVVVGALFLSGLFTGACAEKDGPKAMAAPSKPYTQHPDSGTTTHPPPPPPPASMDSGMPDDGGIFALDSGQLRSECEDITPVPFIGEDATGDAYANAVAMPSDLRASRIVGTWAGTCEPAMIKIEMTDGECPHGDGHGLTFLLDANAIRDGVLDPGIHEILPENAGGPIQVRYVRTKDFPPAGEWGNCDGVSGNLSIRGEPGVRRYDSLQALFEMELTPCDASGLSNQTIQGTFNIELQRSLDTVCPP